MPRLLLLGTDYRAPMEIQKTLPMHSLECVFRLRSVAHSLVLIWYIGNTRRS